MIDISSTALPPFLAQEFDKMIIPGGKRGFALSLSSDKGRVCVACGVVGESAIIIKYLGDAYALHRRKTVSLEGFEKLCRSVPSEVKKSGFVFAEEILDGETYLIKWCWDDEKTKLVLANPRQIDEHFAEIACRLDELLSKA